MSEINRYGISGGAAVQVASGYFPEGQSPSSLNDGVRAVMADVRRYVQQTTPEVTATYAGGAYALTLVRDFSAGELTQGLTTAFVAISTNSASATLNINSTGAKQLRDSVGNPLSGEEIQRYQPVNVVYDKERDSFNVTDQLMKFNADVTHSTVPITPNPTFRAYRSGSDQSMSHNTATKVELNSESWDIGGFYDHSTNYRYTPTVAGYYQVNASIQDISNVDVYDIIIYIYKNGASVSQGRIRYIGATNDDLYTTVASVSDIIYLDGDDYIELYAQIASEDSSGVKVNDSQVATFMSAVLVSRTA